jgi:hypothetical protein
MEEHPITYCEIDSSDLDESDSSSSSSSDDEGEREAIPSSTSSSSSSAGATWTEEQLARLKELVTDPIGHSWPEIAAQLERTMLSCQHRARRLGLKKSKRASSIDMDIVRTRIANQEKVSSIARDLGYDASELRRALRKARVTPPDLKWTPERVATLKRAWGQEKLYGKKLAEKVGMPCDEVERKLKQLMPSKKRQLAWSQNDYATLSRLVSDYDGIGAGDVVWFQIAADMSQCGRERTPGACRSAFKRLRRFIRSDPKARDADESGATKVDLMVSRARGWTSAEMTKLAEGYKSLKEDRQMDPEKSSFWDKLSAEFVTSKNGKQCQQRWKSMRTARGHGSWSIEEDEKLREQYGSCGKKWKLYKIDGRDADSIRMRCRLLEKQGLIGK